MQVHAMLEMEEKLVLACGHMCAVCCHLVEQCDVVVLDTFKISPTSLKESNSEVLPVCRRPSVCIPGLDAWTIRVKAVFCAN